MSDFLIDAPLLACPDPGNYQSGEFESPFTGFLRRLIDLSKLRTTCTSIRFWRDDGLISILHAENCYPFRYRLVQALQHLPNPPDFQLEDIIVLASSLVERSMRIEDLGRIQDVALSACSIVDDRVTGRIVPFDDIDTTASALREVIGDRTRFGAAARARCQADFDAGSVVRRWETIIDEFSHRPTRQPE